MKSTSTYTPASSLKSETGFYQLDGIYSDIAIKLHLLLETPVSVPDTNEVHDDAREYLKMLHLVVTGAWAKETLPEDEESLTRQADIMLQLLVNILDRSFDLPSISSFPQQTLIGIDLSLASLSLANIYAYINREDVSMNLAEETVDMIFAHCMARLIDTKLKYSLDDSSPSNLVEDNDFGLSRSISDLTIIDTAQQLSRILNILLLRLAQQVPAETVLGSLLKILKGCIPEIADSEIPTIKRISPPGSKAISRLMLRVVSEETSKLNAFQRSPNMLKQLLISLHVFFDSHPEITVDEIPFCTAKTLLDQIIKSIGPEKIMYTMEELSTSKNNSLKIPKNSLLSKLISKYLEKSYQTGHINNERSENISYVSSPKVIHT